MEYTYEQKLSLVNELVHLGDADGRMDRDEFELTRGLGSRLGINDADIEKAIRKDIPFTPPTEEADRILWLQAMTMIVIADEVLHENEVQSMQRIGLKLGFRDAAINELLRRLRANPTRPLPPSELLPIFQVAHN